MLEKILKILSVFALSGVKFLGGPPLAFAYDFGYFETILVTVSGGAGGVLLVMYCSDYIIRLWLNLKKWWLRRIRGVTDPVVKTFPEWSIGHDMAVRNPTIMRVWKQYGLIGIALLTPVLISIPIGTFIAVRLVRDKKRVFFYMFGSIVFWSVLMASLFQVYQAVSLMELYQETP